MAVIGMVMVIVTIVLALFLVERRGRQNHKDRREEPWKLQRWLR